MQDYLSRINDPEARREERLAALKAWEAEHPAPASSGEVNNHIHTVYSFSPYTPAMAALRAREAGLEAAGSVDHDSAGAAQEMIAACALLGIGGCSGFEVRVGFRDGPFGDRKINNPDSEGIVYMTVQGIPAPQLPRVASFLQPIREQRILRSRRMATAVNALLAGSGLDALDFDRDVLPLSRAAEGGGLTERHLLAALANKVVARFGQGPALTAALDATLQVRATPKTAALLADPANPHYLFDLLGLLKTDFLPRVFIQPDERECPPAKTVVDFACSVGAIPAYAYLGDVGESPTGDKKAEKFEDEYLDELFVELKRLGYRAVTYMPPRNTVAQLRRVQQLCATHGMMQISGVDINSSRQAFTCPEVLQPEFRHLVDTTWALIAHERLTSFDPKFDLFSAANPLADLPLAQRLAAYASAGLALDRRHPEASAGIQAVKLQNGMYSS